ncbi:hypothetical protein FZ041_11250 [Selenomonas caprae]|uniref:Uncharacterized protein n=1 Tax=Selenomonas caprae TaxID=2606905 RepID=A0A5D6WHB1_9FIRM|nr:hypothetical protein [Selenomonas caprae]TYZ27463.1 hypothetical protein FZ041_11250 [Selenomonas caprae]
MKMKHILLAMLAVLIAAGGSIGYSYQAERTPEYALAQIMDGVKAHDYDTVKRYADVDGLIATTYDESTKLLADDIENLHKTYPQDWFFRHDTAFMQQYIAERRSDDIVFIQRTLELYMDPAITPISRMDGQAKWIADEMTKFADSYDVRVESVQTNGTQAVAVVGITGRDTAYGRLVPQLMLKVDLQQQEDGHWQAVHIANITEAFYPVVKGIEDYWTMQGWQ